AISGDSVVGTYIDGAGLYHGFLYQGTTLTTLDVPGGYHTTVTDISGNDIVGFYDAKGSTHRFLYDGSTYNTNIDPPGSATYYDAWQVGTTAIDGSSIVGEWIENVAGSSYQTVRHGFFYDGSTYTTVDYPGNNN